MKLGYLDSMVTEGRPLNSQIILDPDINARPGPYDKIDITIIDEMNILIRRDMLLCELDAIVRHVIDSYVLTPIIFMDTVPENFIDIRSEDDPRLRDPKIMAKIIMFYLAYMTDLCAVIQYFASRRMEMESVNDIYLLYPWHFHHIPEQTDDLLVVYKWGFIDWHSEMMRRRLISPNDLEIMHLHSPARAYRLVADMRARVNDVIFDSLIREIVVIYDNMEEYDEYVIPPAQHEYRILESPITVGEYFESKRHTKAMEIREELLGNYTLDDMLLEAKLRYDRSNSDGEEETKSREADMQGPVTGTP